MAVVAVGIQADSKTDFYLYAVITVLLQAMGHLASACHTCWLVTGHTSRQLLIQMKR